MTALIKLIIGISLSLSPRLTSSESFSESYEPLLAQNRVVVDSSKVRAFEILINKCNVCHSKRNKRRVFTEDNMNPWAHDVYEQVFIKKRMPKGKKIKLTDKEYQHLLTWVTSTQIQQSWN